MYVCSCPTLAVTEMLVNVLNIHSEDDDDEPTEPGGEGEGEGEVGVSVRCGENMTWSDSRSRIKEVCGSKMCVKDGEDEE